MYGPIFVIYTCYDVMFMPMRVCKSWLARSPVPSTCLAGRHRAARRLVSVVTARFAEIGARFASFVYCTG